MNAMKTNTVTTSNVNTMKCNVFSMVGTFTGVAQMFTKIEIAMSHFDYENENVETIVFAYVKDMCNYINN